MDDGRFKAGNPSAFKPGQSGNPGGRAKGAEKTAREVAEGRSYTDAAGIIHTGAAAMVAVLLDLALDPNGKSRDRREAAVAVLDRGWGRPKQVVDIKSEQVAATPRLPALSEEKLRVLAELDAGLTDEASDDEANASGGGSGNAIH